MRIYVDTNVYLDLFFARSPFDEYAIRLFQRVKEGEFELIVSDHLLIQLRLFAKEQIIEDFFKDINVITTYHTTEDKKQTKLLPYDFEDSLHLIIAKRAGAELFITRDKELHSSFFMKVKSSKDIF